MSLKKNFFFVNIISNKKYINKLYNNTYFFKNTYA